MEGLDTTFANEIWTTEHFQQTRVKEGVTSQHDGMDVPHSEHAKYLEENVVVQPC